MPAGTFSERTIAAAITQHFMDNYVSVDAKVHGDDQQFDPGSATEYAAISIQFFEEPPTRRTDKRRIDFQVSVECFAKQPSDNLYRGQEMADAVCVILDQVHLVIPDHSVSGQDQVGAIDFRESKIEDRTEHAQEFSPSSGQHLLVTVPGTAQET